MEGVKLSGLRTGVEGPSVDGAGFGFGVPVDLLHFPIGFGSDAVQLQGPRAVDAGSFALPFRAETRCNLLALTDHAGMDFFQHADAVVQALEADIQNLNPELFHVRLRLFEDGSFNGHTSFPNGQEWCCLRALGKGGGIDFAIFFGADEFDEIMVGHSAAGGAAKISIEAGQGSAFVPERHEEEKRVRNTPACKRADFQGLLIPCSHRAGAAVPFEDALIEAVYRVNERRFEMQAGFCDGAPLHLAKLGDDDLLGHGDSVEAVPNEDSADKDEGDEGGS